MKHTLYLAVFAALSTGFSTLGGALDTGDRTVQLVYHSDTRGYYLPCG